MSWTWPGLAVQIGLRAYLLGDADIADAVTGIYDYPPDGVACPWIELTRPVSLPWYAQCAEDAAETMLMVLVHARGQTASVDAGAIVQLICARLDRCNRADVPPVITGHRLQLAEVLNAEIDEDDDGPATRVGRVELRVTTIAAP